MKIAKETFEKSGAWIKRNARPLEAARWEYHFEGGSKESVIKSLSAFQNDDGGFGHGIEPDFWSPHSSPMATWAAGQILMEIDADKDGVIVKSMIDYLVNTNQRETGMWFATLPETNSFPHAPWWHWTEGVQENWMFNPGAELAGFLIHWSSEKSEASQIGWSAIEKAINRLMNADKMDKHEINNYQKLLKVLNSHEAMFTRKHPFSLVEVSNKISALVNQCVEKNVSEWATGYKPLPLDFIHSAEDPLCGEFGDLMGNNLNFYIETLSEEGTWDVSWEWGSYPEEFAIARRHWKGILTVDRYKKLKAFGVLDE
ncbi:hypothetical protein ABE096_21935 [Robertmurraya massiliosenegalensis]|uniref:hypothetical protein n=1 Tax=Robertmurraya TaxID=2837507 RepID=UPI0039A4460F